MGATKLKRSELNTYSSIVRHLVKFLSQWDIYGEVVLFDDNGRIVLSTEEGYLIIHDIMGEFEADISVDYDYLRRLRYFVVAAVIELSKKIAYPVDRLEFMVKEGYSEGLCIQEKGKTIIKLK